MKKNYTLIAFLLLAGSLYTSAQVNYSFSATTATYAPIVGGTTPPLINRPYDDNGDYSYTYDEGMADSILIGFTFNYNGVNYNYINIDANGFATLGSAVFTTFYSENYYINSLREGITITKPILAPLWDDLTCQADSNLRYKTTGSPGSRVFTFEWAHAKWQYDASGTTLSFELKLYENTNVIEFCYKDEGGSPSSGASASIGLNASLTQGGGFMSLQNTSASPVTSNNVEADSLYIKPANNQVYSFTPLACKNPLIVQYDSYTNNTINLSCSAVSDVTQYEFAATTSPYPPEAGIIQSSNSITIPALTADTTYNLYVRSYCSASSQSTWIGVDPYVGPVKTADNPVSLPYYEGFETTQFPDYDYYIPEDLRVQDNGAIDYYGYNAWQSNDPTIPQYAFDGIRYVFTPQRSYAHDDWLFLPGINLTAGKTYKFKFHYTTDAFANPNKLEVKYGKAVGAVAMTSGTLFRDTAISTADQVYVSDTATLVPATSATYYIGFHCFSDSGKGDLIIDAISLEDEGSLPVNILDFSGEVNGKQNLLHWSTASEQNNTGFEVQRSNDGYSFNKIGFVNSKAVNGNSNFKLNYDFSDIAFTASANYYRLKQIDKDGQYNYSNIIVLRDIAIADNAIKIYPNPVKDILNIKINLAGDNNIKLLLTDISGKTILSKSSLVSNGETIMQLNVSHLSSGTYFIKLISSDGSEKTVKKFVKQ